MFNKVRTIVSFIDLLGCALGASIILMLIFAESKKQAGKEAGAPRDFIYGEIKLNSSDPYVQIHYKSPDDVTYNRIKLNKGGKELFREGFLDQENKRVYVWGPFIKKNENVYLHDGIAYGFYGVSETKGEWKFAITYFSDKKLDWENDKLTSKTSNFILDKLNKSKSEISLLLRNRESQFIRDSTIKLGETVVFTVNTNIDVK